MNKIHRSLWNEALGVWMAVSEIAKGSGKRSANRRSKLLAASLFIYSTTSYALPMGDQLMAGQANVSTPNANTMQIQQGSQNAVINWQGFSVGQNQAVNIQQPNSQAALLNRVVGQDASQIQGQINANGQVYLVNPNGVLFSKTAQVDVAGLVASTHDISNANFMAGTNHFTQNGATGSVQNDGTINAKSGGVVALIGTSVTNNGTINTPNGTTTLAAGKTVDLDFQGNGLVEVKVSEAALNAQITNKGAVMADGGRVVMSAQAAGQIIDTVINQQGIVRAQSMSSHNGEIILDGGNSGTVQVSGTVDASSHNTASNANATGGNVTVTGAAVNVQNGAIVTASGDAGGGIITIGDKQATSQTTIQNSATVSTQAQNSGNAGTISVYANMNSGTVNVAGKLDASAPTNSNGGSIDTSAAHVKVADSAKVSTKANNGNNGTWLIDPNDFTIGTDITGVALANNLATSNVTIASSQGTSTGNGDIFVNNGVTYNSANSLTLNAVRHVNVNQAITNTGLGSVNLRADSLGACVAGATNCGTINFAGAGYITANTTNLYYNPTGSNNAANANGVGSSYATPTDYSAKVTGTLNAYMLVNDVNQLQAMNTNLGGNYALGNDIDATATSGWNGGAGFVPVSGGIVYSNNTTAYSGNFDGLGHTITGLMINRPTASDVGLFGITQNGSISNVGMIAGHILGQDYVGGLVGSNDGGAINNAYATGSVSGTSNIGGLVGGNWTFAFSYGTINNAYATGNVSGTSYIGGLVGGNSGTVNNTYATGNVSGTSSIGGLVGENYNGGTINNAYATGNVSSIGTYATSNFSGTSSIGGLVGENIGAINNSYATGNVSGTGAVGGLLGYNYGIINNSHYNIDQVLINGGHFVTQGGIYDVQYQDWMSHNQVLNISDYAAILPLNVNTGYYSINNLQGLKDMLGFIDNPTYKFRLNTDIDLTSASGLFIPYLAGEFDGAGHIIANLALNQPFTSQIGMFGTVSQTGAVKNLGLTNVNIIGYDTVGGLVGSNANYGTISNSYATGSVTGNNNIGGLVGSNANYGTISNSYATGSVVGSSFTGGLVGNNGGAISNSYAISSVIGSEYTGGLVGSNANYSTISNSYATGSVVGNNYTGGLAGGNYGQLSNSYATSSVSGSNYIGGLVGWNTSVGGNGGTISNSYATGSVAGSNYTGGLVGRNGDVYTLYVPNAANSLFISPSGTGLIYGTISNSFWNTQTTGQTNGIGYNYAGTLNNVSGKTTAEMQQLATFSSAGWDISNTGGSSAIWRIYDGYTTPLLRSFLIPLTVEGTDQSITYDGLAHNTLSNASYSVAGAASSGHLFSSPITSYGDAINVGSYPVLRTLYSDQQGYDISLVNALLTINPATLTYTADAASRLYGAVNPVFTGTVTGFVNNETLANATTGSLNFSSLADQLSSAGYYAITGAGLTANNGNYNFVQAASNASALTINPEPVQPVPVQPVPVQPATPPITPRPITLDLYSQLVPLQISTTFADSDTREKQHKRHEQRADIEIENDGILLP